MTEALEQQVVDGRRLRSERSKLAIVEAALDLIDEGELVPTAQRVAERAGVGIRSFFRHFEDMEALFVAVDAHARESYEGVFLGGDRDGSLEERIDHFVRRHGDAYDNVWNMVLSTQAQLWRSPVLRKNYARSQRGLRKDLDDWLPELQILKADQREAVDAIASFEMWHRLRAHQNLSKKASIEIIASLIKGLISPS